MSVIKGRIFKSFFYLFFLFSLRRPSFCPSHLQQHVVVIFPQLHVAHLETFLILFLFLLQGNCWVGLWAGGHVPWGEADPGHPAGPGLRGPGRRRRHPRLLHPRLWRRAHWHWVMGDDFSFVETLFLVLEKHAFFLDVKRSLHITLFVCTSVRSSVIKVFDVKIISVGLINWVTFSIVNRKFCRHFRAKTNFLKFIVRQTDYIYFTKGDKKEKKITSNKLSNCLKSFCFVFVAWRKQGAYI